MCGEERKSRKAPCTSSRKMQMQFDIGKLFFPNDYRGRRRKMNRLLLWTVGSVMLVAAVVFLTIHVSGRAAPLSL
jgi:hypothetical protein